VTELNWQQMATGVGDFLAVGMLVVVFKAVFGGLWTDTINRIATLVLATAIPPLAIYAMGGVQRHHRGWLTPGSERGVPRQDSPRPRADATTAQVLLGSDLWKVCP
jgi:hypothetical protein